MKRSIRVVAILVLAAVPIFAFAQQRARAAGRAQITISGVASSVTNLSGGFAYADVVTSKMGPDHIAHKHIGNVKYSPIAFDVALDVLSDRAFADRVQGAFTNRYVRFDGSVDEADASGDIVRSRSFFHGLITEIGFPALDAGSKNVGNLSLKIAPEYTRTQKASGALKAPAAARQQVFQTSNFRFEISGVDTSRVSKVESFALKQKVVESPIGEARDYEREPASIEVPNLTVTVSGSTADALLAWHEDFVIRGNCGQDKEKTGAIVFLAADRSTELMRVELGGIGIIEVRPAPDDDDRDRAQSYEVSFYVETMRIQPGRGRVG